MTEGAAAPAGLDIGAAGAYHPAPVFGAIAQLGERNTGSVEVDGSIPSGSTKHPADRRSAPVFAVRGRNAHRSGAGQGHAVPFV